MSYLVIVKLVLLLYVFRESHEQSCTLPKSLKDEILSYQPIVDQIQAAVINGPYSGVLYNELADYVDTFGTRHAGSGTLEPAIDDVIERQAAVGLRMSTHSVLVPSWTRGESSAEVILPRRQKLTISTLGSTVATPEDGITAEVVTVKDYDELEAKRDQIPGKIVFYNAEYIDYGQTVTYRVDGPNRASKLGAVGALVRSIATFSIDSPHTGNCAFDSDDLAIPAAAITLENANFLARLASKGQRIVVNFKSTARNNPLVPSRNVIADIVGATKPQEYVVISGHIDSWDVGQGALDDGCGAFLSWHSLALIKALGLPTPARTLRSILWTAEETSLEGSQQYRQEREDEARNWTVAFEADSGIFQAAGVAFAGTDAAACIMEHIVSLFQGFNGTELSRIETVGSDIQFFQDLGVPLGEPYFKNTNYFWYHHSAGDWMDTLKSEDLDQNLGIMASTVYILGNLSQSLPKTKIQHHYKDDL